MKFPYTMSAITELRKINDKNNNNNLKTCFREVLKRIDNKHSCSKRLKKYANEW